MIEWSRVTHWQSHFGLVPAETLQLFRFRLCGLCLPSNAVSIYSSEHVHNRQKKKKGRNKRDKAEGLQAVQFVFQQN